jgi:DHA1 family tetracycline resistance protein-like MFS transporter
MTTERAPTRAAFAFIFVTVALDMLALGVMVPVLPKLVQQMEGGDVARAATVTGVFGFAWALMQFLFSPILGTLSDRYGRRPVVLLSNLGLGVDYIFMALAPSVPWLFLGRVISGITSASFPTAGAYIADVTPPQQRAARFGLLGAAFGLGFVIGPAVGGLLGAVDLRLPFWVSAGLSLANFAYGLVILPESLPPERRAKVHWRIANPLGVLPLFRSSSTVAFLAGSLFLFYLGHEALPSVFVLYTGERYAWGERTIGLVLAAVGVCTALVSGGLVRSVVPRIGERRSVQLATACGVLGFFLYGAAPVSAWFLAGVPLTALMGFMGPASQALLTRSVGPSEQGRLQGGLASMKGITGMIGPILFTQVFAWGVSRGGALVGAPYLLASLALLGSVVLALALSDPAVAAEVVRPK